MAPHDVYDHAAGQRNDSRCQIPGRHYPGSAHGIQAEGRLDFGQGYGEALQDPVEGGVSRCQAGHHIAAQSGNGTGRSNVL